VTVDPFANEVLWRPSPDAASTTRLGRFLRWVEERDGVHLPDYRSAWDWSVRDPAAFWTALSDHFELPIHGARCTLDLGDQSPTGLPGARWFPGSTLNAAAVMLAAAGRADDEVALVARSQTRDPIECTFGALRSEVARVRRGLASLGVGLGDRVAAYAPNIPETLVAFLATASLGAIWTSCAPEFGTRSVLDRLTQIRPKVLVAIDGYRYGARRIDRTAEVSTIVERLDSLDGVVHLGYLDPETDGPAGSIRYEALDGPTDPGVVMVPFDHPLYVLYSSGTTGLPKPIVHGHGGITLEHHKALALHTDLGPADRFFWFTTTGWMMWNYLVSGLAVGATLVLFDGDPGSPSLDTLWELAEECRVTAFGVSAPFLDACRRAALQPGADHELGALRWLGSTGAPLHADGFRWVADAVGDLPVSSISGGTDVCTAFVGGAPLLPVQAGVIPCRFLGADVHAVDGDGRAVTGREGELVVTTPMPSMPVGLWGDEDGSRLGASYFARYPDMWWHGDWITVAEDGRCVISGRSDATLNRGGVRLGTADFYAVVGEVGGVADSLVVHLDRGGSDELLAFLVLDDGVTLDDDLVGRLRATLRSELSPRHVPDRFIAVPAIPRTLSGKKTELPVKRILAGDPPSEVLAAGALANPESIDAYVAWAAAR
jgi:acetoacetyl-CoA synthetase